MKNYISLFILVLLGSSCFGQYHFEIKDASKKYAVKINVMNCDKDECSGKAEIELTDKKMAKKFQTLISEDLTFYLNKDQQPTANIIQLYNEQSPLIFDDFNFDGTEDIAVRNGNQSSYGGPSYDVYVYNSTQKKLVLSEGLTQLAYENLGMFQTDSKRKRLTTYSKSGCCWHLTTEYTVVPNKGLVKVYDFEEDATGGEKVKVTKKRLKDNKWITSIKYYPINEYYKN